MTDVDDVYSKKEIVDFWTKDKPRVIGDIVGRSEAVRLLEEELRGLEAKDILDAGCGTGYVSRILARKGANVVGIDGSIDMIRRAEDEQRSKRGSKDCTSISYHCNDITNILSKHLNNIFDGVLSTGVLIHNDMAVNSAFLKESYRLLKPEGVAVISVTHPSLFLPTSPARNGKPSWVSYTPLENKPYNESQRFTEHYMDIDGTVIHTPLWHHTIESYLNAVADSGLTLIKVNEPLLKEEHLLIPEWGTDHGYPAFFQMVLKKVKR